VVGVTVGLCACIYLSSQLTVISSITYCFVVGNSNIVNHMDRILFYSQVYYSVIRIGYPFRRFWMSNNTILCDHYSPMKAIENTANAVTSSRSMDDKSNIANYRLLDQCDERHARDELGRLIRSFQETVAGNTLTHLLAELLVYPFVGWWCSCG
jgi:hypothetical protein